MFQVKDNYRLCRYDRSMRTITITKTEAITIPKQNIMHTTPILDPGLFL